MQRLYLLFIFFNHALAGEWVDPHDMNMKYMNKNPEIGESTEKSLTECNCSQHVADDLTFVYFKRFISLLVSSATPDDDKSVLIGKYFLNKDTEVYNFLVKFTTSEKINPEDLKTLDSVLKSAFSKKYSENILHILSETTYFISNIFNSRTVILIAAVMALLIFCYLLKTNFSFWYIFRYFLFLIWILDYAMRYNKLLEEAELHNIGILSAKCKNLGWFEYYFFKGDEKCQNKVINPIEVALLQLKEIIIIPLSSLGTGTGKFTKELWNELPFPYNFIIFPLILFMLLIMVISIVTVQNQQPFMINIMHLLQLQFGNRHEPRHFITEQRSPIMKSSRSYTFKMLKGNKYRKNKALTSNNK